MALTITPDQGCPPRGAPTFPALVFTGHRLVAPWLTQTRTCKGLLLSRRSCLSCFTRSTLPRRIARRHSGASRFWPVASPAFHSLPPGFLSVLRTAHPAFVLPALACTRTEGRICGNPGGLGRRQGALLQTRCAFVTLSATYRRRYTPIRSWTWMRRCKHRRGREEGECAPSCAVILVPLSLYDRALLFSHAPYPQHGTFTPPHSRTFLPLHLHSPSAHDSRPLPLALLSILRLRRVGSPIMYVVLTPWGREVCSLNTRRTPFGQGAHQLPPACRSTSRHKQHLHCDIRCDRKGRADILNDISTNEDIAGGHLLLPKD